MSDLQKATDAELQRLVASEAGHRKKAIAAEILRRRREAKVKNWSRGKVIFAAVFGALVAGVVALRRLIIRR